MNQRDIKKLCDMLECSPVPSFLFDEEFNLCACNRQLLEIFEFKNLDEFKTNFQQIYPKNQKNGKESEEILRTKMQATLISSLEEFEFELNTELNQKYELYLQIKKFFFGTEMFLICHVQKRIETIDDIKEQQLMAALQMLETVPLSCGVWNYDYTLLSCNKEVYEMLGIHDRDEYLYNYNNYNPLRQPDGTLSEEKAFYHVQRAFEYGKEEFDWVFLDVDKKIVPVKVQMLRIEWAGKPRIFAFTHDLRKLYEINEKFKLIKLINELATSLMSASLNEFNSTLLTQLKRLTEEVSADRIVIWEKDESEDNCYFHRIYCSYNENFCVQKSSFPEFIYTEEVPYVFRQVLAAHTISKSISDLAVISESDAATFSKYGIKYITIIPIVDSVGVWGFLGLDYGNEVSQPSEITEQILHSCGMLLAVSVLRNRSRRELIEKNEKLYEHTNLLRIVNNVASRLLMPQKDLPEDILEYCISTLGQGISAQHSSLWKNHKNKQGKLCCTMISGWDDKAAERMKDEGGLEINLSYTLPEWAENFDQPNIINCNIRKLSKEIQQISILTDCESVLLIPLMIDQSFWGFMCFVHRYQSEFFEKETTDILGAGGLMVVSYYVRLEMQMIIEQTESIASQDSLTGARTRRSFMDMYEIVFEHHEQEKRQLSILFLDLDYFKQVNDTYGHPFGDIVLKSLVQEVQKIIRPLDCLCRYGGEEFIVLLPDTDEKGAWNVAERIRKSMKNMVFDQYKDLKITISVGIATGIPSGIKSPEYFIEKADEALYLAKKNGRNQSVIYNHEIAM